MGDFPPWAIKCKGMVKREAMDKDARNIIVPKGTSGWEFVAEPTQNIPENAKSKVKFEIFGEEMIEKTVKLSGNSGRVYLPPTWVGHHVKIIRID